MKVSIKTGGTSFHGVTLLTTPQRLIDILGEPEYFVNDGSDKTNMDYSLETNDGTPFTIYDWKEYDSLKMESYYHFHIGGHNKNNCIKAVDELKKLGI